MKKLIVIIMIIIPFIMVSCGGISEEQKVIELTNAFFGYASQGQSDSLQLLYPNINFDLFDLESDSIRIVSVNKKENGQMEVQFVKNFSPDNTIESNKARSISLVFEKTEEENSFEYIIINSIGFVDTDKLPVYATECGALKSKKYSDGEYVERLKVAEQICRKKAEEIAELLNKKVSILARFTSAGELFGFSMGSYAFIEGNTARFILMNETDYPCLGFTVYITICSVLDGTVEGTVSHCYNDEVYDWLKPQTQLDYLLTFSPTSIKKKDNWKSQIKDARFEITPEAVLKYTPLDFDGTEYDTYINQHKDSPMESEGTVDKTEGKQVVINAEKLRFRLGPSTNDEVFKTEGGKTFYPNKGDKFKCLGEVGDFYKIEYKDKELYVSKQYTILE